MDVLVAWVLFPLVLSALAVGCGLLVDAACGAPPGRAVAAAGRDRRDRRRRAVPDPRRRHRGAGRAGRASRSALAGLALGAVALRRARAGPLLAAGGVFAVLRGAGRALREATFAGYIQLDDTATWMALTDRVMEHGRDLDGLAPSSYEATLDFNLADGYPVGVFLPLGVGGALVGHDVAWVIQPYMACSAALLALALWSARAAAVARRGTAGGRRLRRRPAGAAVRLLPVGRDQGAGGGGADRGARRRSRPGSIADRFALALADRAGAGAAALVGVLSAGGLSGRPGAGPARRARAVARSGRPRSPPARPCWRSRSAALALPGADHRRRCCPPTSSPLTDADASRQPDRAARAGAACRDLAGGRLPARPGRRAARLAADRRVRRARRRPGWWLRLRARAWAPLAYVGGSARLLRR